MPEDKTIDTTIDEYDMFSMLSAPDPRYAVISNLVRMYRDAGWTLDEALADGRNKTAGMSPERACHQLEYFQQVWDDTP